MDTYFNSTENSLIIVGDFSPGVLEADPLDLINQPVIDDYFVDVVSGENDAFIAKFDILENDMGINRNLIWSTLFRGNANDSAEDVGFNSKGEIYFLGTTDSPSFPTMGSNATVTNSGGKDFFVARFSSIGELNYSGFFGGADSEGQGSPIPYSSAFDIDFDQKDNFYFTSASKSADFPTQSFPGIYNQDILGNDADNMTPDEGKNDAVIVCLDKDMDIRWSSYFGGKDDAFSSGDVGSGIAISGNKIYLTGYTNTDCSLKIPIVENNEANYFQNSLSSDGFSTFDDLFITVFSIGSLTNTNEKLLAINDDKFNVYPNPLNKFLVIQNIESIQGKVNITISDLLGKNLYQNSQNFTNENSTYQINVSDFEKGYYILTLESENIIYSTKLIIQR